MRRPKQNILLDLLLGTGACLLYSKRHQLGDIEDLRDRARESYETASRRIGRASDALRGKDHAVVRTATASLMGVGVGVGAGAYLLYSMRHRLGDIEDLRDRARESYETASRRIGRASDALRGKDHAVVRTATASLMGVGVGVGIGMLLAPASGQKTRSDISEKVKDVREKVRDRSSRKPQGASGTYGQ
jgi:YtxH-like protein